MFPRLLEAYKEQGYQVHVGNNNSLCAALSRDNEFVHTGGGVSLTDVAFFFGLSKIYTPKRILCIGNAAGIGTFCLAEIFDCPIEVMDAEIEGNANKAGSALTRTISRKHYNNRVTLITGFCPEELFKLGNRKYDLIFLDSLHTDEQQLKDYKGLVAYAAQTCVMYLHDVDMLQMHSSYAEISKNTDGFECFNVDFTNFGCKALARKDEKVKTWLENVKESPLPEHRNPIATIRAKEIVQPKQEDQIHENSNSDDRPLSSVREDT